MVVHPLHILTNIRILDNLVIGFPNLAKLLGYLNHITLALPPAPWLPGSLAPYPSALAYALAIALANALAYALA